MSYVFAAHELMAVAAGELNDIGALVGSANTAAGRAEGVSMYQSTVHSQTLPAISNRP